MKLRTFGSLTPLLYSLSMVGLILLRHGPHRLGCWCPEPSDWTLDSSIRYWEEFRRSFWGGDADYWTNPALLGYHEGLRFEHGNTQLVPDLADNVYFKSDRFTFQKYGVGVGLSASPFGRNRLDYGETIVTDPKGNKVGTFEPYETYKYFGFGVSVAALLEAAAPEPLLCPN